MGDMRQSRLKAQSECRLSFCGAKTRELVIVALPWGSVGRFVRRWQVYRDSALAHVGRILLAVACELAALTLLNFKADYRLT